MMWWFDICIHCGMITTLELWTHPSPHIITFRMCVWQEHLRSVLLADFKYIQHMLLSVVSIAVHQVPRTYLSHDWKFEPFHQYLANSPTSWSLVTIATRCFREFWFFRFHVCEVIECLSFCVWLISLSCTPSRSNRVGAMAGCPSSMWLNDSPACRCHVAFVHSSIDGLWGCFCILAIVNSPVVCVISVWLGSLRIALGDSIRN